MRSAASSSASRGVSTVRASDGASLWYQARGAGAPLILCTASFSTSAHWANVESALARRHQVITWDYRGHGRSEAPLEPERYSLAQVVEDLAAIHRAAAGDQPAFVAGLSVGGLVSLSYQLAHPERVRGLLLLNTGPGFKKPEAAQQWGEMLERAAAKMEAVGLEAYLDGRRASAELLGLDPEAPDAASVRAGVLRSSVEGLTRFARQVAGPAPNLVDRLAEVDAPTLILVGSLDPGFHRAAEVMAAKLPNARRVLLEGAGHVLNLDQPEGFVREVEAFLAEF